MRAPNPSSSVLQATTTPRHLEATATVGGALIGFIVTKTPEARDHLESLTDAAYRLGDLTAQDTAIVRQLLAAHTHNAFN